MDDFQGRESFFTRDKFMQEKTQYRFVYRHPRNEKIVFWISELLLVMAMLFYVNVRKEWPLQLLFGMQIGLLVLSVFVRQSLLIGPEGVRQQWKIGPFAFSRHLDWQEVERIQLGCLVMEMGSVYMLKDFRCFWFLGPCGELKRQLFFMRHDAQVYVGEGHTLSLLQAIEKFHAVTQLSKDEEEKIIRRRTETLAAIGGKKVHIVAFTAIALAFLLVLLIPFAYARALETAESHRAYMIFCCAVGLIAFLAACAYTRREKNASFPLVLLLNAMFGGVCGLLMVPFIDAGPAWLGERSEEAFAVVREEDDAQHWQGTASPDLVFTLFLPPEERAHQGIGSTKTFTIYRGPFGMVSMKRKEFRALFADKRRKKPT
jgi:hypothetical protein